MEYTKEQLEQAIIDLLDGNSRPYDIQHCTGLNYERCEQLSAMFGVLVEKHIFGRNVT